MAETVPKITKRWFQDLLYSKTYVDGETAEVQASADAIAAWTPYEQDGDEPFRLRVRTQNAFGLPIYKHLIPRIEAMAESMKDVDIIVFQEIAGAREADYLEEKGRECGLCHSHYFINGMGFPVWRHIGTTGLLVLSRYPFVEVLYSRYSVNGKPYKIHHSDYFGAKGVGLVRVLSPAGMIDVFLSHFHAYYVKDLRRKVLFPDEYEACRLSQAFEAAQFVRAASRAALTIFLGDFNSIPDSHNLTLIREYGMLKDVMIEHSGGGPSGLCIEPEFYTCSSLDNTFTVPENEVGQRIDYILFRNNDAHWDLDEARIIKDTVVVDGEVHSVSDHWGVEADFSFDSTRPSSENEATILVPCTDAGKAIIDTAAEVVRDGVTAVAKQRQTLWLASFACVLAFVVIGALGLALPMPFAWVIFVLPTLAVVLLLLANFPIADELFSLREIYAQMRSCAQLHAMDRQALRMRAW